MFVDINKHSATFLINLIEKRLAYIRRTLIKKHQDDWYDYEGSSLEAKIQDTSVEYWRLQKALEQLLTIR